MYFLSFFHHVIKKKLKVFDEKILVSIKIKALDDEFVLFSPNAMFMELDAEC